MSWRSLKNPISPNKLQFVLTQGWAWSGMILYNTHTSAHAQIHTLISHSLSLLAAINLCCINTQTYAQTQDSSLCSGFYCWDRVVCSLSCVCGDSYWSRDGGCSGWIFVRGTHYRTGALNKLMQPGEAWSDEMEIEMRVKRIPSMSTLKKQQHFLKKTFRVFEHNYLLLRICKEMLILLSC